MASNSQARLTKPKAEAKKIFQGRISQGKELLDELETLVALGRKVEKYQLEEVAHKYERWFSLNKGILRDLVTNDALTHGYHFDDGSLSFKLFSTAGQVDMLRKTVSDSISTLQTKLKLLDNFPEPLLDANQPDITPTKIKILFLSANPSDRVHLQLDREHRAISDELSRAELRDKFELKNLGAVQVQDFTGQMLREKPQIVHFSGHGQQNGEICLENKNGKTQAVSVVALEALFQELREVIMCVILNVCYSQSQAEAIAHKINFVIGVGKNQEIGDEAALAFTTGFYQALGEEVDYVKAFKMGRVHLLAHDPSLGSLAILYQKGKLYDDTGI